MGGQVVRENITRDSLYDRDQYLWLAAGGDRASSG